MARALMLQGTGSNVGKSLLTAGLCRALRNRGLSVAPFKPQNMANNASVTSDGGEIGRAQALQARAAGLDPITDMNPVLLKPEGETGAQIVVQGQRQATMRGRDYGAMKASLLPAVLESFERLSVRHEFVLVEGAGSPAEVNLRPGDIANMGFALATGTPVILVGDIDRGGVIAQIVGTKAVLSPADSSAVQGFVVNKFRGDPTLFQDGYDLIADLTDWPGLGLVPWLGAASQLPAEDSLDLPERAKTAGSLHVACLVLPRIANFDDLDPLRMEPNVKLSLVEAGAALPRDTDIAIIPGSKSTIADLQFLYDQGWDIDLKAHARRGGRILGLCGGYQMLGMSISDRAAIEGSGGKIAGLGLLDVTTAISPQKTLAEVSATHLGSGTTLEAYEMHMGQTQGADCEQPFALIGERSDGAVSQDGKVIGTYLHGLFASDPFRAWYLAESRTLSRLNYEASVETALNQLAANIEAHLDVDRLIGLAA